MYTDWTRPLGRAELAELLARVDDVRMLVVGDLCLDMYWEADMRLSELSRETPHHPLPIVAERYSPGGAGNVLANIAALRPHQLRAIGVTGTDWRGDLLRQALLARKIDCDGVVCDAGIVTNTYIKSLRRGVSDVVYEDPRIDFENRAPLPPACERRLHELLEATASDADVICVSDQMKYGCVTSSQRKHLSALGEAGVPVVVDSRDRAAEYSCVTVKPNEIEAVRAFGNGEALDLAALSDLAARIHAQNRRLAVVTLGEKGCFLADENGVLRVPACPVAPPIDFVGAGDAFLAGFGVLLAAGATPVQAAQVATLCAAVTIKKLGTTGTATREEVQEAAELYGWVN